jgi:hypothetical protein
MSTIARLIMSDFPRRGVIRAGQGMLRAGKVWHSKVFSMIEGEPFAALSGHGPLPEAGSRTFAAYTMLVSMVAERLRVFLQNGDLRSFFFNRQFGNVFQEVPAAYWASPESVAMMQRVFFEAFETQSSLLQPVPRDSIYFSVSDLTEILQPGFAKKKSVVDKVPLPRAKQPKLVDALRSIVEQNEGIRREKQFKLLEELPEFRGYWITDSDFRAAAKSVPVKRGRPPKEAHSVTT